MSDKEKIHAVVNMVGMPVNLRMQPGMALRRLKEPGVARISLGGAIEKGDPGWSALERQFPRRRCYAACPMPTPGGLNWDALLPPAYPGRRREPGVDGLQANLRRGCRPWSPGLAPRLPRLALHARALWPSSGQLVQGGRYSLAVDVVDAGMDGNR
jgi:hypothetical protein